MPCDESIRHRVPVLIIITQVTHRGLGDHHGTGLGLGMGLIWYRIPIEGSIWTLEYFILCNCRGPSLILCNARQV